MGLKEKASEWWEKKQAERQEQRQFESELKAKAKAEQRQGYSEGYLRGVKVKASRQAYAKANQPSFGERLASGIGSNYGFGGSSRPSRSSRRVVSSGSPFGNFGMGNIDPSTGMFSVGRSQRVPSVSKKKSRTITIKI